MAARQFGRLRWLAGSALLALAALLVSACASDHAPDDTHWVASWASSQLVPDAQNSVPAEQWRDMSLRQIVRVSIGGQRLRVKLSNVFGTIPLEIDAASIAIVETLGRPAVLPASLRRLSFGGHSGVTIAAGTEVFSDPVDLEHVAFADIAVSLHFNTAPAPQTAHPGSRTTSFITAGQRVADADWPAATAIVRWHQLAGIDVVAPRSVGAVVVIGDSITDGYGVVADTQSRWTDFFARRLVREGRPPIAVVNAGIGGNRLLRSGLGPSLVSRFDRDALALPGVTHVIAQIGINDLGVLHRDGEDTPAQRAQQLDDMLAAWRQLAERAHGKGLCIVGATIMPFRGNDYYHAESHNEADRQALNRWIRTAGVFDAVIDFDAALRDPARPERFRSDLDNGDHLHPSIAGYRAMAEAVPLSALDPCKPSRTMTTVYNNPVLGGFHADPSVCRVGGDYYLATSSFEYFPGVAIHHSRDLVHWRLIGHALARASQLPLAGQKSSKGIFAPTLRCHDGSFYVVTTNIDGGGSFFVHTRDPAGEWSEPVWLREPVFGMDPSLFFDDDGKVYYTRHGGGRNGGVYQAEIDLKAGRLLGEPRLVWSGTGGIWPEGPHLYKVGGLYYLLISEGGTSYGHSLTVARSRSPWGPFEGNPDNPILTHRERPELSLQAVGHGDLVQTDAGDWWMVLLGVRPRARQHHIGRETLLAPVNWNAQGWPVVNQGRPLAEQMSVIGLPPPAPWPQQPIRDEFDGPRLGLDWAFLRGPADGLWSLSERPGMQRLKGSRDSLEDISTPAFVGRRQEHLRMRAATRLDFTPVDESQAAGLALRQDEAHHDLLRITGVGAARRVELVTRSAGVSTVRAALPLQAGPVELEIQAFRDRYEFGFRVGSGPMQKVAAAPTQDLSSEKSGGFTGVFVGLYATGGAAAATMPPADFAWFDYEAMD